MSGKASRSKGRRGESAFKSLLLSRDWTVHDLSAGLASADLIAVDPDGKAWAVECKATAIISVTVHRKQAMEQAKKARLPWMLANAIAGSGAWLVQRQGERPVVWSNDEGA